MELSERIQIVNQYDILMRQELTLPEHADLYNVYDFKKQIVSEHLDDLFHLLPKTYGKKGELVTDIISMFDQPLEAFPDHSVLGAMIFLKRMLICMPTDQFNNLPAWLYPKFKGYNKEIFDRYMNLLPSNVNYFELLQLQIDKHPANHELMLDSMIAFFKYQRYKTVTVDLISQIYKEHMWT